VPSWDAGCCWNATASEREVHGSAPSEGSGKQFSVLSSAPDSSGVCQDRVRYEKLGEARRGHSWLIRGS
jgi:hypothetical protein